MLWSVSTLSPAVASSSVLAALSLPSLWGQPEDKFPTTGPELLIVGVFLCLYVWIQQRVQLSWTQTGTLGRRQTASLSWPFTPTQTAVAAGVEVWEMVMPTARGAQGVRRTHTPTVSLSRRPMVLPSPRRMTCNLYSAYSRWMAPVLCVFMILTPEILYIEFVFTVCCMYRYIGVCFKSGCEHATMISVHLHTVLLTDIKQDDEIRGLKRRIFW